jgi:hypothetical protein
MGPVNLGIVMPGRVPAVSSAVASWFETRGVAALLTTRVVRDHHPEEAAKRPSRRMRPLAPKII